MEKHVCVQHTAQILIFYMRSDMAIPPYIKDQDERNETLMLHELARQLRTSFNRKAQHLGLTRSQWRVLAIVRRKPGIRQAQIADMMEVEPITLVRLLDRMAKAKWIERQPDPSDRRANRIYLTDKVQGILSEMRAIALNVRAEALKGFTPEEHAELLSYLTRMRTNMTAVLCGEDEELYAKK